MQVNIHLIDGQVITVENMPRTSKFGH